MAWRAHQHKLSPSFQSLLVVVVNFTCSGERGRDVVHTPNNPNGALFVTPNGLTPPCFHYLRVLPRPGGENPQGGKPNTEDHVGYTRDNISRGTLTGCISVKKPILAK